MKLLSSIAFCLAYAYPALAIEYDETGICVKRVPSIVQYQRCDAHGRLTSPNQTNVFPAFDIHECGTRCFSQTPRCQSLGFSAPTNNTPGSCTLYGSHLVDMGFKKRKEHHTLYFDSSCFGVKPLDDSPLQDGGFSNSGVPTPDPWSGSGSENLHDGSSKTGYYAYMHYESDNGVTARQDFALCSGETYALSFDEGDKGEFIGSALIIELNGVIIWDKTSKDGAVKPRAPIFFTVGPGDARRSGIELYLTRNYFIQPPRKKPNFATEYIDNMSIRAVFRSSVPSNATVTGV